MFVCLSGARCVCVLGGGGGGGNAIWICAIRRRGLLIRDRVSFFEPDSKTGCQICTITPSPGALPLVLTYFSFAQEINPSFDVFNIFIVTMWHTVEEFVRVSFENNSFLCFDTLCGWLLAFPSSILPPGATLKLKIRGGGWLDSLGSGILVGQRYFGVLQKYWFGQ